MTTTLPIGKGELLLADDRILIKDNAKRDNRMAMVSSAMWTVFGILSVLRYMKGGDEFLLWSGVLIGFAHFALLIGYLFRTSKSELLHSEIRSVKLKSRFGRKFVDFVLESGRKRRVTSTELATSELEAYLSEKNLQVK